MPLPVTYKDRVKETTLTTGTGTYTLAGAVQGFQAFSAIGDGALAYYAISDGTNWEVGTGTYTLAGTTLARTTVHASSNGGAAVDWGTGSKIIWADAPAFLLSHQREVLTANRTYYWRQDGSDSNTGLVDSAAGAFLTAQKAVDVLVASLDLGGYTVTIRRGGDAGATYTGNISVGAWVGGGAIAIDGASRTHQPASGYCIALAGRLPGDVTVTNMKVATGGLSNGGVGSLVIGAGIIFGECPGLPHINVSARGARVGVGSNYTISGSAGWHINAVHGGLLQCNFKTITVTSASTFTYFVNSATDAEVECIGDVYSGSSFVTGQRYLAASGGIINTNGGSTTYFPGTIAGAGTNFGASPYGYYF